MRERNARHLRKVLVEQLRDVLGLEALRGGGEVLDVREKDRELLPLILALRILFILQPLSRAASPTRLL
jgi:hypothetical protein